jgi:hypothetical protein
MQSTDFVQTILKTEKKKLTKLLPAIRQLTLFDVKPVMLDTFVNRGLDSFSLMF